MVGCLFGLIVILSFSMAPTEDYNNDYANQGNSDNFVEEFTISGVQQTETIQSDYPVYLILSGVDNTITIHPNTEIRDAVISGVRNKLILCNDIHKPTIQKSGVGIEVIYRNC